VHVGEPVEQPSQSRQVLGVPAEVRSAISESKVGKRERSLNWRLGKSAISSQRSFLKSSGSKNSAGSPV
jgi:hypothetical protein